MSTGAMLSEGRSVVRRAASAQTSSEALAILRELGLDDFGSVLLDPASHDLDRFLPSMPAAEIQARWCGTANEKLLPASLSFVRTLESVSARCRGRSLH